MSKQEEHFNRWKDREEVAEAMISIIGTLYRERNIIITVFSRPLVNKSIIDILQVHRLAKQISGGDLSVRDTMPVLEVVKGLDLGASRIDVGKLAMAIKTEAIEDIESHIKEQVADAIGSSSRRGEPQDVVLFGFGRIGRLLARLLIEKTGSGDGLRLKAIVVRKGRAKNDLEKRANLLKNDSVHGPFEGTMEVDYEDNAIIANGNFVPLIYANSPGEVDFTQYGIDNAILVDNTGVWKTIEDLSKHIESPGIKRVILTAPGKGDMKNIVFGINNDLITEDDVVLSAASCTTNAIVPPLKAISDKFGLEYGHVETVHAYTNDQNLIDNYHTADRRGRSAPLNMVITSTGAASAAVKALPELKGKLTGNAIRVPTPNVSMAILNLTLEKETSLEEVNDYFRYMSLESPLQRQIDFITDPDAVSSDFVGSRHACVIDAEATIVEGRHLILYVWYDNEFGYSCQVLRMLQQVGGMEYPKIPAAD